MSYEDPFRPSSYIHEHDTFDVIGKPLRIREIRPSNFDGPVKEWAEYRTAVFGDIVRDVLTLPEDHDGNTHRVSWVYHAGRDIETDEAYARHHIACDCSLMAELSGEADSIFECPVLQKTLNRRTGLVRGTLLLDKLIRACIDSEDSRSSITLDRGFIESETIMWIMRQDNEHPESWMGNITSGEHTVSLIGLIIQKPPDNVRSLVEYLADEGRLEFDGEETLRLAA